MKKFFLTLSIITAFSSSPTFADAPDHITSIAVPRYAFTCGFIYGLEFVLDNDFEKMIDLNLIEMASDVEKLHSVIGYFKHTQDNLRDKMVLNRRLTDNLTGMSLTGDSIRNALLLAVSVLTSKSAPPKTTLERALAGQGAFRNLYKALQDGKTASCEDVIKP